ncbi:MAG: hypothetical protein V4457_06175 [Pseudomonadota bacterium]
MKVACIQRVSQALGHQVKSSVAGEIESRIATVMRRLARLDPMAWRAKSATERYREAAIAAADELVAEKQLALKRQALSILAQSRIMQHIQDSKARGLDTLDALSRVIAFKADGKSNYLSVESRARAIERDALRQMIDTLEASHPKWFGLFENPKGIRAIIQELFHENSGDADARNGAKLFQDIAEGLRQRNNRAGADVGQLDDWGMPHHHSQVKVAKAGRDGWVADTLPLLNRKRYVNEDGTLMSDKQVSDFLSHAWETIATAGANKVDPGRFAGGGMRANRGSEQRQIHFKDSQSYLDYQSKYGERSLYEVLLSHIAGVSKDVALTETMGPNPDHTFRYFKDALSQEQKLSTPTKLGKINDATQRVQSLYDVVSGKTQPIASEFWAKSFDTLRNWLIAARLGSSVITSFSDDATMHMTAHLNNLPEMKVLANELAAFNPANRAEERRALRAGLAMNTLLASLNRFGQDGLGTGFSKKLSNAVLRVSGLNAMTEARKRGFGVTMLGAIGETVSKNADLANLSPTDHRLLLSRGITPTDWQVWRKAKLENWGGGNNTMLTPESIYRIPDADLAGLGDPTRLKQEAATKLLGSVLEETDVAVIEPGARERVQTGATLQRGTLKGELTKSFFLFKSFPLAMIERHVMRGMSLPNKGGRAVYLATLLAATTVLGMASLQVDQVLQGKDPRDMNLADKGGIRNWIAAMLKGGSLGIYGDFLFSDTSQHGNSPIATITGPVLGTAEDVFNLTQGNIVQAIQGKPTNAGAELVRFAKGNTPGASLWYAKAALDHLIYQQLQEYFSPGYLATVRSRSERDFGQRYWWEPGQATPDRAPDPGAAFGN